jgi:two-component system OmpR family response regulator
MPGEHSRPKHILVVDDDSGVRDVIVAILRELAFKVGSAEDGSTMRKFLRSGDPVDAIVLDLALPDEVGEDLALNAKDLGVPVVLISGNPGMMQFAAEHDLQLLEKPFGVQALVDAVTEALDRGE